MLMRALSNSPCILSICTDNLSYSAIILLALPTNEPKIGIFFIKPPLFLLSTSKPFTFTTKLLNKSPTCPLSLLRILFKILSENSAIFRCAFMPYCTEVCEFVKSIFSFISSIRFLSSGEINSVCFVTCSISSFFVITCQF